MFFSELTDVGLEVAYSFLPLLTWLDIIDIIEMNDGKEGFLRLGFILLHC